MAFNKLTYKIDANSSGFTRELKKAETAFDRFQRENKKGLKRLRSASLLAAKGIGVLATAATAAAATIGVKSVKAAAGFERAIVSAGAKAGATSEQLKQMEASALSAASGAEFSARQAADAMGFLAAAGFNVREQMAALPGILNLASAGEMDLAQSADLASNVLSQFSIQVEDLGRVNDVLVKAANSANTSVYQLGEALSYSGPAAKGAGISLEETVAAIGKLSDAGIQADRAGSGLTQILIQMRAAAKKMGVELSGADIASLGFAGSLQKLTDAGLTAQNAGEFFTSRAQVSVQAILSQGIPAIQELDAALQAAGGTAQEVADKKIDTLQGSFNILSGNIDNVAIALGQRFSPAVRAGADYLSEFSQELLVNDELLDEIGDKLIELIDYTAEFSRFIGIATNILVTFGGVLGEVNVIFRSIAATAATAGHGVNIFAQGIRGNMSGMKDAAKDMASSYKRSITVLGDFGDSTNAANAVGTKFQDTAFGIADGLQNIAAKARVAAKAMKEDTEFMGPIQPGQLGGPSPVQAPAIATGGRAGASRAKALRDDADRLLSMVETPFERYSAEIEKLDKAMAAGYITTDKYGQIVRALKEEFDPATKHAVKLMDAAEKLGERFGVLGQTEMVSAVEFITDLFDDGEISVQAYTEALAELQAGADYFVALSRESEQLRESLKTPFDIAAESIQRYEDMLSRSLITTEEFKAASARVGEDIYTELTAGVDEMLAEQEAVAKKWEDIWEGATSSLVGMFSDAFGDAFLGVLEGNVDSMKDAVRGLIKEFVILAAKAAVLNAIQAGGGEPSGILGRVLGFAGGGYVSGPGTSTSDSIPARLSDGEYVIRARAVQKWGVGFMDDLNAGRTPASRRRQKFASGGLASSGGGGENIRIVNVTDPSEIEATMAGPAGERVIINTISRRATEIKRVLA